MANNNNHTQRYCVIMCGGIGSRFWPSSTQAKPKQFIDFMGTGRSLLQMTYDRIRPLVPAENILVVTNADYIPQIREQLPELAEKQILAEPARRNTAPCILWAAHHIKALAGPEASMIVTPSDHLILKPEVFRDAVEHGFDFVEHNDAILTLGIEPSRPETGYGYIQMDAEVEPALHKVKTFTEKPDRELAKVFLASGDFKWNAGVFLWRVDNFLKAMAEHSSDLASRFQKGEGKYATEKEKRFIQKEFPACPAESIDYALMEKASNVYVRRVDPAWSDLGTWGSLYEQLPKNRQGNVTSGCQVLAYDTKGTIFSEEKPDKVIVAHGLDGYVVADTADALLICPLSEEQRIKQYVNDVKSHLGDKYL